MYTPLLSIHSDDYRAEIKISFPSRVVSTNTERMREQLARFFGSAQERHNKWTKLELDFTQTVFIDSIGLNLLFDLVKTAEARQATLIAWVSLRAVRLTLYTVRLDKRMDIRLVEGTLPPSQP